MDTRPVTPAAGVHIPPRRLRDRLAVRTALGLAHGVAVAVGLALGLAWLVAPEARSMLTEHSDAIERATSQPVIFDLHVSADGEGREAAKVLAEALAKPRANEVITASLWGIDYSEVTRKNDQIEALSTTTIEALPSALPTAQQTERHSQNIYVCNHDTTNYACVGATTWASTCSALTMTCRSGASTDGLVVKPSSCRAFRFLGTERPCLEATAAVSAYDVERIVYQGTEY